MIKITITIEETFENKAKKNDTIKGKYIIANSNFDGASILGVPCKVVSKPFMGTYKSYVFDERECMCINVVSCITGIQYTIPYDKSWLEVHDTFISALVASESFLHRGYAIYPDPEVQVVTQINGKKYYPMDNSYSKLLSGRGNSQVAGEEVEILGTPYTETTNYGKKIPFVNVRKKDGSIVKCMFMEWKLFL